MRMMKVKIADGVVFRELAEESVLLHLPSGMYYGLDETGTRIWQVLAERGSTDEALASLLEEYEVGEERLRRDVEGLVRQLAEKGLVTADG
jgi:hypothetical protein